MDIKVVVVENQPVAKKEESLNQGLGERDSPRSKDLHKRLH